MNQYVTHKIHLVFGMAEIITTYISLGIAVASILFVLWDHYKDDRLMSKRVKSFYQDIEEQIFSFYNSYNYRELWSKNKDNKQYEAKFFEYEKKHVFYRGKVNHNFDEYSKYLGLTYYAGNGFYINGSNYFIEKNGGIFNFFTRFASAPELNRKRSFFDSTSGVYIFNEESIRIINSFLEALRAHWNKYYHKRILFFTFRKKLKPKRDFFKLIKSH